ncbi:MAG: DUF3987 domain-containing protein [Acidobacteria bacterium]|nr:DUF3987 domain-containing protein [Acidobacteriota bacterium]
MNSLWVSANRLRDAGIATIPIKPDGSKAPAIGAWAQYESRLPTEAELQSWFGNGAERGIALIGGKVSGNLEILDFDAPELIAEWRALVEEAAPGLLARLPQVQTPTGGLHILFRCSTIQSNQKLAEREVEVAESTKGARYRDGQWFSIKTMIETRGEGGYVLTVGSPGQCHPSGKQYQLINGDLTAIPQITEADREVLLTCARSLNQYVKSAKQCAPERAAKSAPGLMPGQEFNQRGDVRALLEKHGWKYLRKSSAGEMWQRPGGDHQSATLFPNGNLFIFSSNAAPLEPGCSYSPFALLAELEHGGDFQAAARALAAVGYGDRGIQSAPTADNEKDEWEAPASFNEYELPEFPVDSLPAWLAAFVTGLARETQTPPDLPAMLALSVCAGAVAGNVEIEARQGWREPLNLFTVVALPPGNRKSAVFSSVMKPLEAVEANLIADRRAEVAQAESEYRTLAARIEHLEKLAAKAEDDHERAAKQKEATQAAQELAATRVPKLPRLLADDATPETLATLLHDQKGRIALFSPEGDLFDLMAGRYSNGSPNLGIFLKGHAGDDLRVDRRGRSEYVKSPALTIGLAIQPDVLRGLVSKPAFKGRGLLGRFLYALPKSTLGSRKVRAVPLDDEARAEYASCIRGLAGLSVGFDEDGNRLSKMLRLSPDADDYLAAFQEEIEPQLAEAGELGALSDWAGKLPGAILRIAGILHLAEHASQLQNLPERIGANTIKRAIEIGRYLIPHAQAAYAEMGADPEIEAAKIVLRWIEKTGDEAFTKRQAFEATKGRFKKVENLEPALRLLEEHGYIRTQVNGSEHRRGRKASQLFAVNPFLLTPSHNSHNSHNSPPRINSANSANSANDPDNHISFNLKVDQMREIFEI